MQYDIQDRRRVYAILESEGIEIPRYAVLDRDSPDPKRKCSFLYFFNGKTSENNIISAGCKILWTMDKCTRTVM